MTSVRAPAKLNLCLFVGRPRSDGLHELRSLFCPLELADRISFSVAADGEGDEVVCEGVSGRNLAADALAGLRRMGWPAPPVRVEIDKRIPIAAGLGGGSADAAAVLRNATGVGSVAALARSLGADVPSQIAPAFSLVAGAGELLEPLPAPRPFGVVLIPFDRGLSAAEVYAKADEMEIGRTPEELNVVETRIRGMASSGASPLDYTDLMFNDLEAPAMALHDEIRPALEALRTAGAKRALTTGSGPTVFGVFEDIVAADRAAASLPPRYANAIVTVSAA